MTWSIKVSVSVGGRPYLTAAFDSSPVTLGALPHNDVVLNDPYVSGEHAEVMLSRGQLVFRDKSTNGSYIGDRRIEEEHLGTEATVSIPPYEIELRFEEDETAWRTSFRTDLAGMVAAARNAADPDDGEPQIRGNDETTAEREVEEARADLDATTPASQPPAAPRVTPPPQFVAVPPAPDTEAAPPGDVSSSRPILRVEKAPEELEIREFVLAGELRVGRGESADIRIPIGSVSRWHAAFRPQTGGGFTVVDLESSNGTFVNGERIREVGLRHGDVVTVGEVELVFLERGTNERARPEPISAVAPTELHTPDRRPASPTPPPVPPPAAPVTPPPVPAPAAPMAPPSIPHKETPVAAPPPTRVAQPAPPRPEPVGSPTAFGVSIERTEGPVPIHVATLQGRIDGYTYTQLSDALDQAIEEGARHLVIDLSRVDYVTHAGLGVFVKCLTRLRRQRGDLRLSGLNDRIRDAFSLSRLDSLFRGRLSTSLDEALREWNQRI